MRRSFLLISICLLLGISFIAGETLVVPDDFLTKQSGLYYADSSDTVYI